MRSKAPVRRKDRNVIASRTGVAPERPERDAEKGTRKTKIQNTKKMIAYEWTYEVLGEHGDIIDNDFSERLCNLRAPAGADIGLVRRA